MTEIAPGSDTQPETIASDPGRQPAAGRMPALYLGHGSPTLALDPVKGREKRSAAGAILGPGP